MRNASRSEDACRDRIRALETRLSIGRQLLLANKDPQDDGWSSPASLLWGVRWLGRAGDLSIFDDVAWARRSGTLNVLDEAGTDEESIHQSMARAMSYLYPSEQDLIAFRTLLQLATGAAPEEWSGVTMRDLESHTDALHVRVHKARAHRTRTIRCPIMSTDTATGWKAGDLVRRLIVATGHAREEAASTEHSARDALFLTVQRTISRHLEPRASPFHRKPFSALLSSISPEISQPHDARRLRKTVKSVQLQCCEAPMSWLATITASPCISVTTLNPPRFTCSPAPPSTPPNRRCSTDLGRGQSS